MEDGLVLVLSIIRQVKLQEVLILVVVEDGLVLIDREIKEHGPNCLNPCCSGRWSRTRPYKTLLIINKLKSIAKEIFTFLN